ncbi:hypothetical protein Tco_0665275 [Tanacetum coccineum]
MRRVTKGYSGEETPLFATITSVNDQTSQVRSTIPSWIHHTPLMELHLLNHTRIHQLNHLLLNHIHHPYNYLNHQLLQQLGKLSNRNLRFLRTPVADEAAFTGVDVVHGEAVTTISSIDAGQGSGNITKSPTKPHVSPFPGGHTPGSDEGKLKQTKQTYGAAFTKLIKKVKKLEQTIKTSQVRKRTKIIASDDEEDLVAEDPSKQGRIGRYGQNLDTQEGFGVGLEVTNTNAELNTASTFVSTASPQRHANTTADDLTLAETLMKIRKRCC